MRAFLLGKVIAVVVLISGNWWAEAEHTSVMWSQSEQKACRLCTHVSYPHFSFGPYRISSTDVTNDDQNSSGCGGYHVLNQRIFLIIRKGPLGHLQSGIKLAAVQECS
jgi:hypothetical protein